jgi:RimJ/RimL family protein N-acetyltransferase
VLLTVADALRRRGLDAYGDRPPAFGWWRPDGGGEAAAAYLRTPPYPPLLTRALREAARELAGAWARGRVDADPLTGVRGDRDAARAFAEGWRERTGGAVHARRDTRLFRLAAPTAREPAPPGAARVALPADRALALRWQDAFSQDIGTPVAAGERVVDDALARGGRTLWELPDGEPVAMAGVTAPAEGTVRVMAVYTPPRHPGRGYGTAVTAAVSRAALDAGAAEVLLFTDLANPVSNALYRRIGYVPVRDAVEPDFTDNGGGGRPAHR